MTEMTDADVFGANDDLAPVKLADENWEANYQRIREEFQRNLADIRDPNSWELASGSPALEIERLNSAETLMAVEELVTSTLQLDRSSGLPQTINEGTLRDLHRCATRGLMSRPGEFREGPVWIGNFEEARFQPPEASQIANLMVEFFEDLREMWSGSDGLDVTAFAHWRIIWIHPFRDGNGRTARAFCYACMCAHLGHNPVSAAAFIAEIVRARTEYVEALNVAHDAAAEEPEARNLGRLRSYLGGCLTASLRGRSAGPL